MENQKIKVGIFTSGSSIRVIGEHDLFEQSFGHRKEAIYLSDIAMTRDPSNPVSQAEIDKCITSIKNNFRDNNASFKANDRSMADAYIKSKINPSWTVVRPFSEI